MNIELNNIRNGLWGDILGAVRFLIKKQPKKYFIDIYTDRIEVKELIVDRRDRYYQVLQTIPLTHVENT